MAAVIAGPSGEAFAVDPGFGIALGREYIDLPGIQFGIIKNNFNGGGGHVGRLENSNGKSDGARLDMSFGAPSITIANHAVGLGIKGFYSWHGERANSQSCQTGPLPGPGSAIPFCTVMPLFDPRTSGGFPAAFNTPFDTPRETIAFLTRSRLTHWGAALEIELPLSAPPRGPSQRSSGLALSLKGGPAYRRLGRDVDLTARGVSIAGTSTGTVSYAEELETQYWGGYIGALAKLHLGRGFSLALDGEVGLYRAHTEYFGRYAASGATGSGNPAANVQQSLALTQSRNAMVSSVKVSAEQDFGPWRLGAFARSEFYSYAPGVAYNDNDRTGGAGQNLTGPNNGTSLRSGDARTLTVGVQAVVPLSSR